MSLGLKWTAVPVGGSFNLAVANFTLLLLLPVSPYRRYSRLQCALTVRKDMPNSWAISELLAPVTNSAATCSSLGATDCIISISDLYQWKL